MNLLKVMSLMKNIRNNISTKWDPRVTPEVKRIEFDQYTLLATIWWWSSVKKISQDKKEPQIHICFNVLNRIWCLTSSNALAKLVYTTSTLDPVEKKMVLITKFWKATRCYWLCSYYVETMLIIYDYMT